MFLNQCLVLGVLSALIVSTTQLAIIENFFLDGDYYIKLENIGRSWSEAQQMCNQFNSTLPVVDNLEHKRIVDAAVHYFYSSGADIWLGANASDYGSANWRWIDGRQYSGTEVQNVGTYNTSYAFLSNRSSNILAYSAPPSQSYSYICKYNTNIAAVCKNGIGGLSFVNESQCFVKHNEKLSWFNARNNCLLNNGDLASIIDISSLGGIVDTSGSWVGLRHSQWNWQNSVIGLSSEVKFTSWQPGQPNDVTPTCMSIVYTDFPNWKDFDCSHPTQYICQVVNTTFTISSTSANSTVTSVGLQMQTSGSAKNGYITEANDRRLSIGLGVGLGSALIIAIVVVIIVMVFRRKHRKSESSGKSNSTEIVKKENDQTNPEGETRSNNQFKLEAASALYGQVKKDRGLEPDSKHISSSNQSRSDDSSTHYASVKEVKGLESDSPVTYHVNQGPVYADLGFEESRM